MTNSGYSLQSSTPSQSCHSAKRSLHYRTIIFHDKENPRYCARRKHLCPLIWDGISISKKVQLVPESRLIQGLKSNSSAARVQKKRFPWGMDKIPNLPYSNNVILCISSCLHVNFLYVIPYISLFSGSVTCRTSAPIPRLQQCKKLSFLNHYIPNNMGVVPEAILTMEEKSTS
jgi:hypothetical protein